MLLPNIISVLGYIDVVSGDFVGDN